MTEPTRLRPSQEKILKYDGGWMGISAVPGSGKTWTLSRLAADIILRGWLEDDQEVLVVTLTNSAVDNFSQRISAFLREAHLMPNMGYRVRTLHGLANDIVRQRPELAGLDNRFQIVSEPEADTILDHIVSAWMPLAEEEMRPYLDPHLDESKFRQIFHRQLPELVRSVAKSFIRTAKNKQLSHEEIQQKLAQSPPLPLTTLGWKFYADYQSALNYRGSVDFDDLIRLALRALHFDKALLESLQRQFPFILEDEAQDSNNLQEDILRLLVSSGGNWVRVGDPNQAIYETFTTASPEHLRSFLKEAGVVERSLPESGRSVAMIYQLANHLIEWTMHAHPLEEVRNALSEPFIQPAPENDPKPNPGDNEANIYIHDINRRFTSSEEIKMVVDNLAKWLPEHPDATVAALAATNQHCFSLVDELERRQIPYNDSLLRSTSSTRQSAGVISSILQFLASPHKSPRLVGAFRAWQRQQAAYESERESMNRAAELLKRCRQVEAFLNPAPQNDWLAQQDLVSTNPRVHQHLTVFRQVARRWQGTVLLPIDQIVLTLAQDLFSEPTDLALAYKLARVMHAAALLNPQWRLPQLSSELAKVASNQHRFLSFSENDSGFDPDRHRGMVVVATIHKAKGLEWDRVYLMSVNNYDFPAGDPGDDYISEKYYIRDRLNLQAETLRQFELLFSRDEYEWYEEGAATKQARLDYVRERLRLLFVGITRARKELILTWNSGKNGDKLPALAYSELWSYLKTTNQRSADKDGQQAAEDQKG